MPQLHDSKILPYTSSNIKQLILDIDKYQEFLPWCTASKIISKNNNIIIADLTVQYGFLKQKYRSKVEYLQEETQYKINVTSIEGPFEYLTNKWVITQAHDINSCKVEFSIDFKIGATILGNMVEKFFAKASQQIIQAFEERANVIYR